MKELIDIVENSLLPAKRACRILGLRPKRFYRWRRWRKNYTLFGVDGLVNKNPVAKVIANKLLREEEEAIYEYAELHPEQRHREIQYNLDKQGLATISFSSVYPRLKKKDLIEDKPKIYSDNGSQMKAKSFKAFLMDLGILNEYSRPHVPQD